MAWASRALRQRASGRAGGKAGAGRKDVSADTGVELRQFRNWITCPLGRCRRDEIDLWVSRGLT